MHIRFLFNVYVFNRLSTLFDDDLKYISQEEDCRLPADLPVQAGASAQIWVRVVIYDILGREAATLVKKHLKPGIYEVTWDPGVSGHSGSGIESGVYFYKLVVGDNTNNGGYSETKKLILMK